MNLEELGIMNHVLPYLILMMMNSRLIDDNLKTKS